MDGLSEHDGLCPSIQLLYMRSLDRDTSLWLYLLACRTGSLYISTLCGMNWELGHSVATAFTLPVLVYVGRRSMLQH